MYKHKIRVLFLKSSTVLVLLAIKKYLIGNICPLIKFQVLEYLAIVSADLSWSLGQVINSCINSNYHDNIEFTLKYPTLDYLVQQISQLGSETLLFKVDLERAFRNLKTDPYDYPMFGLKWDRGIYNDIGIPFGFSIVAASCHLCTDPVTYTLHKRHIWTMNFWMIL